MREPWHLYWRNYYEILQLHPAAEMEVIEGAYRRLAGKFHPDKPAGDEDRMKLIIEAYSILHDASKRREYDAECARRRRSESVSRAAPEAVLRVSLLAITGNVSRAGERYRFQIRIEGDNEGDCTLGWSGATINVPTINSRDRYLATEIQMSSIGCNSPFREGPGDMIWSFLDDGSFGQKPATCLLMECVREEWRPHQRIALEVVLFAPFSRLDAHVRVWSTRPKAKNGDGFGDPDWKSIRQKDQQGIPAYPLSLGFD
jgi:hypothetical protein